MTMKLILFLCLVTTSAYAMADVYDIPEASAVMNRKFFPQSEKTLQFGYLPAGAYNKYLTVGGSYLMQTTDHSGWEVLNLLGMLELETKLKKALKQDFTAEEKNFSVLQYVLTTNYIFSPFYTKSILFNAKLVQSQLDFVGGGGLASFSTLPFVPTVNAGVIQRFFINEKWSVKFDFRYYYFITQGERNNHNFTLITGFAYLGGDKK